MYREDYFYGLSDILQFNVRASFLHNRITSEERGILKVFKRDEEVIVIEFFQGKDEIIKDINNFDLVFLKAIERYISDYKYPGMIYEYIEGLGSWYRVKIDNYDPLDKRLKPFYLKKKIKKSDLKDYVKTEEDLQYIEKFWEIKGNLKFNKPKDIKKFFETMIN